MLRNQKLILKDKGILIINKDWEQMHLVKVLYPLENSMRQGKLKSNKFPSWPRNKNAITTIKIKKFWLFMLIFIMVCRR